jgi:translin
VNRLESIVAGIQERLDEKDALREVAIKSSRAIIRLSGGAIHALHKGGDVEAMMGEALDEVQRLRSLLAEHQDIWHAGIVQDAMQEFAEAAMFKAIAEERDIPAPDEVGVDDAAYLLGMADVVGELRRLALEALRHGDTKKAEGILDIMEDLFQAIMGFDYPDAIVSIRRKQDVARSLLEKTRGEVAVAISSKRLEEKIERSSRRD